MQDGSVHTAGRDGQAVTDEDSQGGAAGRSVDRHTPGRGRTVRDRTIQVDKRPRGRTASQVSDDGPPGAVVRV